MPTLNLPATFVNNVNVPVSATDVNLLREAAIAVDGWTYRTHPAFDSSAGIDTWTPGYYGSAPPFRNWRGYFLWRTGYTTLTIIGRTASAPAGATIKMYVNDSGTASVTLASPLPATFTSTVSISSGYTDGQLVALEIKVEGTGNTTAAEFVILDAYVSPVVFGTSWPGVPTFAGTYDSTRLNQLINAAQWLYDRINLVPFVPNRAQLYALGPFGDPAGTPKEGHYPLYYGSVLRAYTNDILRVAGYFTNVTSTSIRYKVYVGGALAATSSTYGPGTYTISVPVALTHTIGTRAEVSIYAEVVNAGPNNPPLAPWRQSRWSLQIVRSEADGSGYAYATPPAAFAYGSLSATTLNSRLNAIATMLDNAKTRIDARPEIWERVRLVRRWYGRSEVTNGNLDKRAPMVFQRRGDRVIVSGGGCQIAWGALSVPSDPAKNADDHTWSQTAEAVPGDKIETRTIWLDSLPGLEYGMLYYVTSGSGMDLYSEERLSP